jgi:hypothetical protein
LIRVGDHGPPEAQRERLALHTGPDRAGLAVTIAGVLLAHDIADGRQRAAAEGFRQALARVFGVR